MESSRSQASCVDACVQGVFVPRVDRQRLLLILPSLPP